MCRKGLLNSLNLQAHNSLFIYRTMKKSKDCRKIGEKSLIVRVSYWKLIIKYWSLAANPSFLGLNWSKVDKKKYYKTTLSQSRSNVTANLTIVRMTILQLTLLETMSFKRCTIARITCNQASDQSFMTQTISHSVSLVQTRDDMSFECCPFFLKILNVIMGYSIYITRNYGHRPGQVVNCWYNFWLVTCQHMNGLCVVGCSTKASELCLL
jgi:hypothetical protein